VPSSPADTGKALRRLRGHSGSVLSCGLSADGVRVVSAGLDGTLLLGDAATGKTLRSLQGHSGWVWSCALSADGARVVSAGQDGTVRLWDAATGKALRVHRVCEGSDDYAVWEPAQPDGDGGDPSNPSDAADTGRILFASGDAWRWLGWQCETASGEWIRLPMESFGAVAEAPAAQL
jgi:WD40 repeat protein